MWALQHVIGCSFKLAGPRQPASSMTPYIPCPYWNAIALSPKTNSWLWACGETPYVRTSHKCQGMAIATGLRARAQKHLHRQRGRVPNIQGHLPKCSGQRRRGECRCDRSHGRCCLAAPYAHAALKGVLGSSHACCFGSMSLRCLQASNRRLRERYLPATGCNTVAMRVPCKIPLCY